MNVPFVDLRAQNAGIADEVVAAVEEVISNAAFILGPAVSAFEEAFADVAGTRFAVALNSGTSALHLGLLALGVGPGDEVITPAMTFVATQAAVAYTGARPVIVDIDSSTFTIDPNDVERAITPRTKAIIPVHLYGQTAPMADLLGLAQAHGISVLEDAAQAHLAEDRGLRAGSLGQAAAFSFYPSKNLGAWGEGGAVTTDDPQIASKVRSLRDWGQTTKGIHESLGYNYRMSGIQGAALGVKLRYLEAWTEARRRVATLYQQHLGDIAELSLPRERPRSRHVYHVYAAQAEDRDRLRDRLRESGISTAIHYPLPVHLQPCFSHLGYNRGDFPNAERLAQREISLPLFAEMNDEQIGAVALAIRRSLA